MIQTLNSSLQQGLVVRIAGSHPAGPSSIPGVRKHNFAVSVCMDFVMRWHKLINFKSGSSLSDLFLQILLEAVLKYSISKTLNNVTLDVVQNCF